MKTITIDSNLHKYSSIEELKKIISDNKYNFKFGKNFFIGDNANIQTPFSAGDDFYAKENFYVGEKFTVGKYFFTCENFRAGDNFTAGNNFIACENFRAGDSFTAGNNFFTCENFRAGDNFTAGNNFYVFNNFMAEKNFRAGDSFKAKENFRVTNHVIIPNGYEYVARCYFEENSAEWYIQMGCYLRTLEEWENDFWNNEREFPDDGSPKSVARLETYNMLKNIIKLYKLNQNQK